MKKRRRPTPLQVLHNPIPSQRPEPMSSHKRRRAAPRRASWLNDSSVGARGSVSRSTSFEHHHHHHHRQQQQQQQQQQRGQQQRGSHHLHDLSQRASLAERGRGLGAHSRESNETRGHYSSVVSPYSRPRAIGSPSAATGTLRALASSLQPRDRESKDLSRPAYLLGTSSYAPASSPSSASLYSTTYTATPTTGPKRSPGTFAEAEAPPAFYPNPRTDSSTP